MPSTAKGSAASGGPPSKKRRFSTSHQTRRRTHDIGYSFALVKGREATRRSPNENMTPARPSPRDGRSRSSHGSAARKRKAAAPASRPASGRYAKSRPRMAAKETDTSETAALTTGQSVMDRVTVKPLTFDMSGNRRHAKHAGGCPLDGGVRPHSHLTPMTLLNSSAAHVAARQR